VNLDTRIASAYRAQRGRDSSPWDTGRRYANGSGRGRRDRGTTLDLRRCWPSEPRAACDCRSRRRPCLQPAVSPPCRVTAIVYIRQAVADNQNTPSMARGVLRTALDPATGALIGPSTYIATTAGLDGNQPTAAAIGPDGSLYVGFVKSGNVKRILNPGVGSTQVVQSGQSADPGWQPGVALIDVDRAVHVRGAGRRRQEWRECVELLLITRVKPTC
jgi:hypothetical protein